MYASPKCSKGEIDISELVAYVRTYMEYATLNQHDLESMGRLFFQFCAVCNFYGQYYASQTRNREIFLKQAHLSSDLLVWFEKHVDELTEELKKLKEKN